MNINLCSNLFLLFVISDLSYIKNTSEFNNKHSNFIYKIKRIYNVNAFNIFYISKSSERFLFKKIFLGNLRIHK